MALAYTYFPPQYFPPDYFGDLTDSGIQTASAFGVVRLLAIQPVGLRNPVRASIGAVVVVATAYAHAFNPGGPVYRDGEVFGDVRLTSHQITTVRVVTGEVFGDVRLTSHQITTVRVVTGEVQLAPLVILGSVLEYSIKTRIIVGSIHVVASVRGVATVNGSAFGVLSVRTESSTVKVRTTTSTALVELRAAILYGQGYSQPIAYGGIQITSTVQVVCTVTTIAVVKLSVVGLTLPTTLRTSTTMGVVYVRGFARSSSVAAEVLVASVQLLANVYGRRAYRIRQALALGISMVRNDALLNTFDSDKIIGTDITNETGVLSFHTDRMNGSAGVRNVEMDDSAYDAIQGNEQSNDVEVSRVQSGNITGTYIRKGARGE